MILSIIISKMMPVMTMMMTFTGGWGSKLPRPGGLRHQQPEPAGVHSIKVGLSLYSTNHIIVISFSSYHNVTFVISIQSYNLNQIANIPSM